MIYAILSLAPGDPAQVILGKPAIYLYPQEETEVLSMSIWPKANSTSQSLRWATAGA